MSNPPLVDILRGNVLESFHRGAYAIVDARGNVAISAGDIERPMIPRSAFKLFQAIPLVETGADVGYGVRPQELALACASHNGESDHVETVEAWLRRLHFSERDLECGPEEPRDAAARDKLILARCKPSALHNNCSGKHTGFLTVARHLNVKPEGYTKPAHPVQRLVRETIAEVCGLRNAEMDVVIDGCSAPNLSMPLRALAHGMARCAWPESLSFERGAAVRKLTQAVTNHPHFVAGTGRSDTQLIAATKGKAIIKIGAEGVYAGFVPELGFGIAVKIDDGSARAATSTMCQILVRLQLIDPEDPALTEHYMPVLKNASGAATGKLMPTKGAFDFELGD